MGRKGRTIICKILILLLFCSMAAHACYGAVIIHGTGRGLLLMCLTIAILLALRKVDTYDR